MTWVLSGFADEASDTIDGQIAATKRAGMAHIDLRNVDGYGITALPLDHARTIRRKLDAAGIAMGMFGSPIGKIDIVDDFQKDVDQLDHLGKLKDILGCDQVRMFSYYNREEKPMDQWRAEAMDRLKRLRDQAGKLGLILCHENERHIFGDHGQQIVEMAETLRDGEAFQLIFDFDNYQQSGDDVWQNWDMLRDATDAFHLKDSDTKNQHTPVGMGNGCVKPILADAVKCGWTGMLTLEPHLRHSAAVMATGAHGTENQQYKNMDPAETYQAAADVAIALMKEVGATLA